MNREKIGYEPEKELKFKKDELIAGRYQYQRELGDAAFSTAVQCFDIKEKRLVCIKIIKNNKDYFDQSIDEIKLLRYINANGDPDSKYFLRVYDYFYYKEHLMIVSELLKDNLYDFYKYLTDNNNTEYFSVERIQKLTKQILICLEFIHDLKIIHCDLKPENILMKSITDATCKVIDFGSSCFVHDHLSAYIQSRSYRAPEVILGCRYDYKIDMWSLGCILAEIYTGNVLFQNDSIQSMLARIIGICGPIPNWMYEKGKLVNDFFTKEKLLYMEPNAVDNNESMNQTSPQERGKKVHILVPKKSSLRKRIRTNNEQFFNFLSGLLKIDPNDRMSAKDALNHPFIKNVKI
jgi:serine/threonine protein kinase